MAASALVSEKDPDLTVLDASGGAAILALHTDAPLALFEKAGFIHNQHATGISQVLAHVGLQVIPHRICFPDGSSQQMLKAVGARITGLLGQLPTVLALDRAKKSLQISQCLSTRLGTKKTRADSCGHLL